MSSKEFAATFHKAVFRYEKGEEYFFLIKTPQCLLWPYSGMQEKEGGNF